MIDRDYLNKRHSLAQEWGLNFIQFSVMLLVEAKGEIAFDDIQKLSGQAGFTLRSLVDRNILSGPSRREKVRARPFTLSDLGKLLLNNIRMGLHPTEWLIGKKINLLRSLILDGDRVDRNSYHPATLKSLQNAGYVSGYSVTDIGQRAWTEYQAAKAREATEKSRVLA